MTVRLALKRGCEHARDDETHFLPEKTDETKGEKGPRTYPLPPSYRRQRLRCDWFYRSQGIDDPQQYRRNGEKERQGRQQPFLTECLDLGAIRFRERKSAFFVSNFTVTQYN